jgi:kinetochore protein Spc7/SPC105
MGVPVIPVEEERPEDWEPETIGLAAFLEMAGVQFIDTLPGMNRRRSSVGRARLGQSALGKGQSCFSAVCDSPKYLADVMIDRDFATYEYTDAKVHSVFLNMYNWVCLPSHKLSKD